MALNPLAFIGLGKQLDKKRRWRERGSAGVLGVFLVLVLAALLWGMVEIGLWLSAAARARMAAEAGVHAALSARDWVGAQACGCPRLDPGMAMLRGEAAIRAALGDGLGAWSLAVDPGGTATAVVTVTVPETMLGWLGIPGPFQVARSAAGQLEWWDWP